MVLDKKVKRCWRGNLASLKTGQPGQRTSLRAQITLWQVKKETDASENQNAVGRKEREGCKQQENRE
jgi:hypothetical protein